ncbi:hypothetical protein HW49_06305 [Porphyromonadaceae bacterium COT-184 OH4590]|nr:hypothetical protein HW49_06305 [Porphyromonadaceae bacterium COT-184 OH4590]
MKKKKLILIVSIVAAIILCIAGAIIYCYWFFPTKIELKNNAIDENHNHIILKNSKLCWDTGANISVLFEDFNSKKICIGFAFVSDYNYKTKLTPLFLSKSISKNSVLVRDLIYTDVDSNNIAKGLQCLNISGILGMNIIGNYNWLLDFNTNTLYNILKIEDYNFKPQLSLTYSSKLYPYTFMNIGGLIFQKILIDSGSNSDIQLQQSDIERINKTIQPDTIMESSSSGLFSDSIPHREYVYTNIKINEVILDTLSIIESHRRLIGTGFFRKFDRVFWDSKDREVKFYRD